MNFEIYNADIGKSFDRIAKEILINHALYVNDTEFRFTEIEFYYFCEDKHEDNYTHEHRRKAGEWRFHNQGLDITFNSDEKSDGGILIRGVLSNGKYTNGPRKVVGKIFEAFGNASNKNTIELKQMQPKTIDIYKTFRYLPNKNIEKAFHRKSYRYLIDLPDLDIPNSLKAKIRQDLKKV